MDVLKLVCHVWGVILVLFLVWENVRCTLVWYVSGNITRFRPSDPFYSANVSRHAQHKKRAFRYMCAWCARDRVIEMTTKIEAKQLVTNYFRQTLSTIGHAVLPYPC